MSHMDNLSPERVKSNRWWEIGAAVGLFLVFAALYFQTRTAVHTFDALSYTNDVETKPIGLLYHPHHLLYGVSGRLAVSIAEGVGYEGRADQPIQALNALAGALGVVVLWRAGVVFSGRRWLSLPIAALIGCCYAYWFYATEVEVYTLAALFLCLCLWLLATLERASSRRQIVLLALATAGAVMYHQTNAMFAAPIAVFLLLKERNRRGLKDVVMYGGVLALGVGLPYLAVGWNSGFRDVEAYINWLTDYAQTGQWGGYLSLEHRAALQDGLFDTVTPHSALWPPLFYLLALAGLFMGARRLSAAWWGFGGVWLVLYGGFFWWWEPWNIEFWIALLPLWAFMMLAGLRGASADKADALPAPRFAPVISLTALGLALILLGTQYAPVREAAQSENDYFRRMTDSLSPQLAPSDFVLTRGNILDLYLPFYAEHPPSQVLSLRTVGLGQADRLALLLPDLNHAYARGQIIYIDALLLDEPADPQRNPFGLSAEEIAALRGQFPLFETVRLDGETVFYSIGQRQTPDTRQWAFDSHLGGWLESGMNAIRFENEGWCFTGGGDPWLESPPLQIDASQTPTLTLVMSLDLPAEYGQLYWRRADEGLSEENSLRFPLQTGRQTYTLDLSAHPGWSGEVAFLRLDPIPGGSEATACLYELALE